jgi:orotidine-5'-phosphate decarboxylase
MGFVDLWLKAVEKNGTTLCAGIDPSEYAMGRTEKGEGLPAGVNKRDWALKYIEAVAPHVAAIKPNLRYWLSHFGSDLETLTEMAELARSLGIISIQDSKEADIGSTNDSGAFYAATKGFDFLTIAAFAGNVQEAVKQGNDRGIGLIGMCLMSSPEYAKEKSMWVNVTDDAAAYDNNHIKLIDGVSHVRRYIQLARDANRFGLAGVVVGAPSAKNHIKEDEIANVNRYVGGSSIILVPGIGAQGGEVTALAKNFDMKYIIANVGRGLMFPNGAYSTSAQQADAAKTYSEMLRKLK